MYQVNLALSIIKVYHVYRGWYIMKKTEYISFRTDPEIKNALEKIASEKKWTTSFVVEEIIKDWLKDNADKPNKL